MNITEAARTRRALPRAEAGAARPRVGTWAFERLAVEAFDRVATAAGGTLDSSERGRIRAELAERFEVRRTRIDWVKDVALTLSLGTVAGTVLVFLVAIV